MCLEQLPGGVSTQTKAAVGRQDIELSHYEIRVAGAGSFACNESKSSRLCPMCNEIGPATVRFLPVVIEIGVGPGHLRIGAQLLQIVIHHAPQERLIRRRGKLYLWSHTCLLAVPSARLPHNNTPDGPDFPRYAFCRG